MLHFMVFAYPVLFPVCMEIQQLLVSVETQHLQLVLGQRPQQQGPHPPQLVTAYRPARPQLQVSFYVVLVVSNMRSCVGFSC